MMDAKPDPKDPVIDSYQGPTGDEMKRMAGRIIALPEEPAEEQRQVLGLAMLREQFPDDMIEKLPKPMWKGAWDDKRGSNCPTCHGYHVLEHCIHLDYVGHANVTNRLLSVDPYWSWEPMALTEAGTPLFSDGGLWIKLTVCGLTRIGYGDGKSVKEVIGDAIRNAAMRFGVGLDLWAKIDLHAERNPGDGSTSNRQRDSRGQSQSERNQGRDSAGAGQEVRDQADQTPSVTPEVQDALDSLVEVCNECGYDQRNMQSWYARWASKQGIQAVEITTAKPDNIKLFAAELIAQANGEPNRAGEPPTQDPSPDANAGGDEPAEGQASEGDDAGVAAADGDEAQAGPLF